MGPKIATGPDPMMLEYGKAARIRTSNITQVQGNWHDQLQSKYGQSGRFLLTGLYHEYKMPNVPAELTDLDPESLEYDMTRAAYKESYLTVVKMKAKDAEKKVQIYADMWSWCSKSLRAELSMDPYFVELDAAGFR